MLVLLSWCKLKKTLVIKDHYAQSKKNEIFDPLLFDRYTKWSNRSGSKSSFYLDYHSAIYLHGIRYTICRVSFLRQQIISGLVYIVFVLCIIGWHKSHVRHVLFLEHRSHDVTSCDKRYFCFFLFFLPNVEFSTIGVFHLMCV